MSKVPSAASAIVQSIYSRPDEWKLDVHHCSHKEGVTLWIANGLLALHVESMPTLKLGLIGRLRVWLAIKWLSRVKAADSLGLKNGQMKAALNKLTEGTK